MLVIFRRCCRRTLEGLDFCMQGRSLRLCAHLQSRSISTLRPGSLFLGWDCPEALKLLERSHPICLRQAPKHTVTAYQSDDSFRSCICMYVHPTRPHIRFYYLSMFEPRHILSFCNGCRSKHKPRDWFGLVWFAAT